MDVDLCAGGDGTRKKVELTVAADGTMDVVPLEMYDSARAKIAANLRWLFAKAYGIGKLISNNPSQTLTIFVFENYWQPRWSLEICIFSLTDLSSDIFYTREHETKL